jgi:hypothetical protein
MNEIADTTETARHHDPREVLDGIKRAKILAMLELGCSRRVAAKHLRCAASTITRTAQRDTEFAAQLFDAESQAEMRALKLIGRMLDQEKYWRVAAWMLERRDPEEYGRRAPFTFRGGDVISLLQRIMELVMPAIAANKAAEIRETFYDLLDDVAEKANLRPPERDVPCTEEAEQDSMLVDSPSSRPSTNGAVPLTASQAASPAQRTKTRAASGKNGHAPRLLDDLLPPQPRTSCLEKFVQRLGKPELQPAGA